MTTKTPVKTESPIMVLCSSGVGSYGDQSYSDLLSTNFFLHKDDPDDISAPLAFYYDRTRGLWNKVK